MNLENKIKQIIMEELGQSNPPFPYRTPLIGFADALDPMYSQLSSIIGNNIILPTQILPDAKTVIVFFIPFSEQMAKIARENRDVPIVQEWSDYYTQTNILLSKISERIELELSSTGIKVASQPPTNNYDEVNLTVKWPHKSSAVIAGIGTFGLNRLLITKLGTMGRLNSLIINETIPPTPKIQTEYCLYYKNKTCKFCIETCPSGALTFEGIDKFRCDSYLCGKNIRDSQQGCPGCSMGPCAFQGFE